MEIQNKNEERKNIKTSYILFTASLILLSISIYVIFFGSSIYKLSQSEGEFAGFDIALAAFCLFILGIILGIKSLSLFLKYRRK